MKRTRSAKPSYAQSFREWPYMQAFKDILVAVDSNETLLPELERARQIAHYSGGSLHIVDVLRDLNAAARLLSQWQTEHEKLAQEKRAALEMLAEASRKQGIPTTCELLHGNTSQQLLLLVQNRHVDLLVKRAKGSGSTETGAIGATANQLLSRAPCSLWLTEGDRSHSCGRILAAIDATPDDEAHSALNRSILQRSLDLVQREGCQLDVVYVWDIFDSDLLRGRLPEREFDEMIERNRLCHEESYERELSQFGLHVSDAHVHMLRGVPTVAIPEFCRANKIDLIVCGTVARIGLSGIMIGNTANRMLNKIPCSILAIKPEQSA